MQKLLESLLFETKIQVISYNSNEELTFKIGSNVYRYRGVNPYVYNRFNLLSGNINRALTLLHSHVSKENRFRVDNLEELPLKRKQEVLK